MDDRIIITTASGQEIACVYVETIEHDHKKDEKWKTEPTKNFWVRFVPTMKCWMDDSAEVIVEGE
jgi:hypothetical protein